MRHYVTRLGGAIIAASAVLVGLASAASAAPSGQLARLGPPAASPTVATDTPFTPPPDSASPPAGYPRLPAGDQASCYFDKSIRSTYFDLWVQAIRSSYAAFNDSLVANAAEIGPWEKFALCYDRTASYWYIVANKNSRAVVDDRLHSYDQSQPLIADRTVVGRWERFGLTCIEGALLIRSDAANGLVRTSYNPFPWRPLYNGTLVTDEPGVRNHPDRFHTTTPGQGGC